MRLQKRGGKIIKGRDCRHCDPCRHVCGLAQGLGGIPSGKGNLERNRDGKNREGRLGEMLRILTAHRKTVLTGVREKQKQIDCLDYLTNQIRQQNHG